MSGISGSPEAAVFSLFSAFTPAAGLKLALVNALCRRRQIKRFAHERGQVFGAEWGVSASCWRRVGVGQHHVEDQVEVGEGVADFA